MWMHDRLVYERFDNALYDHYSLIIRVWKVGILILTTIIIIIIIKQLPISVFAVLIRFAQNLTYKYKL